MPTPPVQVNLPFEVWYRCLSAVLMPFGGMQQGLWFNVETAFGVKEPGVETGVLVRRC